MFYLTNNCTANLLGVLLHSYCMKNSLRLRLWQGCGVGVAWSQRFQKRVGVGHLRVRRVGVGIFYSTPTNILFDFTN